MLLFCPTRLLDINFIEVTGVKHLYFILYLNIDERATDFISIAW